MKFALLVLCYLLSAARSDLPQIVIGGLARDKVFGERATLSGYRCEAATY